MNGWWHKAWPFGLLGAVAGFVNGFLGTGGGIVLLLGTAWLDRRASQDPRDRYAGTALVMLLLSGLSAAVYFATGRVKAEAFAGSLLPAAVGGAVGAWLLDRIPTVWLDRIFACLTLVAGGLLLLR